MGRLIQVFSVSWVLLKNLGRSISCKLEQPANLQPLHPICLYAVLRLWDAGLTESGSQNCSQQELSRNRKILRLFSFVLSLGTIIPKITIIAILLIGISMLSQQASKELELLSWHSASPCICPTDARVP